MARTDGTVSATVLQMILTGAFSGALIALILSRVVTNQVWMSILTAFLSVIVALLVRRAIFGDSVPLFDPQGLGIWQAVISALVGGLAGHELVIDLREPPVSPLIGATAGLMASILMATFVMSSHRRS